MSEKEEPLIHPSTILITLLISGMAMLFVGLTGAYLYNRFHYVTEGVQVPLLFYLNTVFILGSSLFLHRAKQAYDHDDEFDYLRQLSRALASSLLFLILQAIAWYLMLTNGMSFQGTTSMSYLFVIPMIHFAHLLGGIPFLLQLILVARKRLKDPAGALVFFSDPYRKRRLGLVTSYWHFVDALWVYLVLFFTVNAFL